MITDDLEAWVDCLRRRRYPELSTAVWDLLWLAAQHRSFVLRPKAGVGLEFIVGGPTNAGEAETVFEREMATAVRKL